MKKKGKGLEVSIYTGDLTSQVIRENMAKVKAAFPSLPAGFYLVLHERVKDNGFSDRRLIDAVNHVIDNHVYPNPSIAEFISYDKKIRLYTYDQMLKKANESGSSVWKNYKAVDVSWHDKKLWAEVSELNKYGIDKL